MSTRFMGLQAEEVRFSGQEMPENKKAKIKLTEWAYRLWLEEFKAHKKLQKEVIGNGITKIWHRDHPNKATLLQPGERCSGCHAAKHKLIQCRHDICAIGGIFDASRFAARWIIRQKAEICPRSRDDIPRVAEGIAIAVPH